MLAKEANSMATSIPKIVYFALVVLDYVASVQEARSGSTDRDVVVSRIWQILALYRWSYCFMGCTWQEALARNLCADASDEDERSSSIHIPASEM